MSKKELFPADEFKLKFTERPDFELFKSSICHYVKNVGDIQFLIDVYASNIIELMMSKGWQVEALYILAMADYLSRVNDVELVNRYDYLRSAKLSNVLYPRDVVIGDLLLNSDIWKEKAMGLVIPEFIRHNIVEYNIRGVA